MQMPWWLYLATGVVFAAVIRHLCRPCTWEEYRSFRPLICILGGALMGLGIAGIAAFLLAMKTQSILLCRNGAMDFAVVLFGGWVIAFRYSQNKPTKFRGRALLVLLVVCFVTANILITSIFWPSQ